MAYMPQALTEEELRTLSITKIRGEYLKLAEAYNKLINGEVLICDCCREPLSTLSDNYYTDKRYSSGFFPTCKKCVLMQVEQRTNSRQEPNETKESVQAMLRKMDLPYIDSLYEKHIKKVRDASGKKNRSSPFLSYLPSIKSLPQYAGFGWDRSELGDEDDTIQAISNRKPRKEIVKLFGSGLSVDDYLYLQDQYDEWKARTQVDSKSQETYIVRICFKLLDIWKAQKEGKDTTKLDDSLSKLMGDANLQPKQNVGNASTDALTFGQLIEKWENESPIPSPDPEFEDVDGIAKYIDVFFKGHLAKMMGLKNGYSHQYDDYMKQYTINKPEYDSDDGSDAIFDSIFGKEVE